MNTAVSPIYVRSDLHYLLKKKALKDRKRLRQLCEEKLWPVVRAANEKGKR